MPGPSPRRTEARGARSALCQCTPLQGAPRGAYAEGRNIGGRQSDVAMSGGCNTGQGCRTKTHGKEWFGQAHPFALRQSAGAVERLVFGAGYCFVAPGGRKQVISAPHMHVLVCIWSNVRQFFASKSNPMYKAMPVHLFSTVACFVDTDRLHRTVQKGHPKTLLICLHIVLVLALHGQVDRLVVCVCMGKSVVW